MRLLVGLASAIVIVCGAYYLYSEWSASRAQAERLAGNERARVELFEQADALPHEESKVRKWCRGVLDVAPDADNRLLTGWARNCRVLGYAF